MTDASEMTLFEIVARRGVIIFADEDLGVLFTWNGSLGFQVFQHGPIGRFYVVDTWTVTEAPKDLDAAVERCHQRLVLIKADMEG